MRRESETARSANRATDVEYRSAVAPLAAILLGPSLRAVAARNGFGSSPTALSSTFRSRRCLSPVSSRRGSFLADNHEIVSLPSAAVLAQLRRQIAGRASPPKTVAVFADPVFERDDERLRGIGGRTRVAAAKTGLRRGGPIERSAKDVGLEQSEGSGLPRLSVHPA